MIFNFTMIDQVCRNRGINITSKIQKHSLLIINLLIIMLYITLQVST